MINGHLMPQNISILPSVLSICYIGATKLTIEAVRSTFHVQCYAVAEALQWLKTHNLKYYGDIDVVNGHLALLPVNEVPQELLATL